jgi:hypothetical protein
MDEKHRQYCIRLGNPYMEQNKYNKVELEPNEEPWIPVMNNDEEDWQKNSRKFTN